MAEKAKQGVLSSLTREVARERKEAVGKAAIDDAGGPRIFNILEYIEQPWGLHMDGVDKRAFLFPAQRFIVKLFYNLPLDEDIPEDPKKRIQVRDVYESYGTKVKYEFSEAEYLKYLFNEGRCNIKEQDHDRRELVLALGRRSGKCVVGETLVPTDRGIFRIEDLGEASDDSFAPVDLGVAQEGSIKARATAFYNGGVKPTIKVKTRSGYTITGTGNHRIKVMTTAGRVEWRYLDEIELGEYVGVHRSADLWATEALDLCSFHNDRGRKEVDLPQTLDEDLGNLLGYLVGDGTWGDAHAISVTVEHSETWDHLQRLFTKVFGVPRVQMDLRTQNTGRLEFCSVRARQFLSDIGWTLGCARDAKMVPWSILRSPKLVVGAFLRGLFETDGCAENGGSVITFSSASFKLAHEVQVLLLNFGIVSSVARKWNSNTKRHYANLTLKGKQSRQLFAKWIGFDSDKKRLPMLAALEAAQEGKSNTESVPHQRIRIRDWLESIPRKRANQNTGPVGWGRSQLREALGNSCKPNSGEDLTYPRLRKAIAVARDMGASEATTSHFEELLRLDYFYDPVVSLEEGEDQVYDLSVPEGETFVANGLTNHNTTLSGVFASYEVYRLLNLYNPQMYYGLPNGYRMQIISVATDKEQASLLFNEVSTHINKCDYFKPYLGSSTLSRIDFRTPYDIEAYGDSFRRNDGKFASLSGKTTLRVTFKGSTATGLRGAGNIVIILDEVAHFQETGPQSAQEIYTAVSPSAAAFSRKNPETGLPAVNPKTGEADVESRTILISSPLGRSGLFFNKFDQALRGGKGAENIIAVQAPTWEINPTVPAKYYREKYHENPTTFVVEHGAQFSDQAKGWIERKSDLLACVDPNHRPVTRARPKMPHQMGIDVGLVGDGTAVVITHVEDGKIVLDYHEIWYAGKSWRESNPHLEEFSVDYAKVLNEQLRLDFDEIGDWIAELCKRFYITAGMFDRWNGLPLEQALHKKGLKQFKTEFFTRDATSKMYQTAKMLMWDESLRLYDYPIPTQVEFGEDKHSPLIAELFSLQAKQLSKNIVMVEAPQQQGAHDDLSDALIRAIWLSAETLTSQKHVYQSTQVRPHLSTAMTPQRYQAMRNRRHGSGDRSVPRNRLVRSR